MAPVIIAMLALATITGCWDRQASLEENAKPLISQIIKNQFHWQTECFRVKITGKIDEKHYNAIATLTNGKDLEITIEDRGDMVFVQVNKQTSMEEGAKPLVTRIIREQLNGNTECFRVKITEQVDEKHYQAIASLANGNDIKIMIEDRGDNMIFVSIPEQ